MKRVMLLAHRCATLRTIHPSGDDGTYRERAVAESTGLDGYTLRQVMGRFHVPGVSVAVIKDFEIHWAKGYRVADVESGAASQTHALSGRVDQQAGGRDGCRPRGTGRRFSRMTTSTRFHVWKLPDSELTRGHPVTPRALLSHTWGSARLRISRYHAVSAGRTVVEILTAASVQRRARVDGAGARSPPTSTQRRA